MKKNLYLRTTFKDIRQSLGRFIAIILIIFMGVLLFVGIKSVGPNLEETVDQFVKEHTLSDIQLVGTQGLTKEDQKIAETITGTEADLGYSFPSIEEDQELNLQIYSYSEDYAQNQLTLVQGDYPENIQEILVDVALQEAYPLNSTIQLKNDQLKENTFKVVGYIESPLYVDTSEKGLTTVGDGHLDGYVYLLEEAFDSDSYSIMYLRFTDLNELGSNSQEYKEALSEKEEQLENLFSERKKTRKQEIVDEAMVEINENQQELAENSTKLADGQEQLAAALKQIQTQKDQLAIQRT